MIDLEALGQWLQTFPKWEERELYTDYTAAVPGNDGLFPLGMEELSSKRNIMGGFTVTYLWRFLLCRVVTADGDNRENAQWLMDLQGWIREQSSRGLTPSFGDDDRQVVIRAEKGKLKEVSQAGTAVYSVELTVQFVIEY